MPLENLYQGYILKQQDLGEADVLLTFFARDAGKLRFLVKSAKKITSKLSGRLQPYNFLQVSLAGRTQLPKLIGVETLALHPNIFSSFLKVQAVIAMQEILQRALPDQLPNNILFDNYSRALLELDQCKEETTYLVLTKFVFSAIQALGFAPEVDSTAQIQLSQTSPQPIYFSFTNGKFSFSSSQSTDRLLEPETFEFYLALQNKSATKNYDLGTTTKFLGLLTDFLSYQLERELKSVKTLLAQTADTSGMI